eukprot:2726971-Rhodomonas_salina.1
MLCAAEPSHRGRRLRQRSHAFPDAAPASLSAAQARTPCCSETDRRSERGQRAGCAGPGQVAAGGGDDVDGADRGAVRAVLDGRGGEGVWRRGRAVQASGRPGAAGRVGDLLRAAERAGADAAADGRGGAADRGPAAAAQE